MKKTIVLALMLMGCAFALSADAAITTHTAVKTNFDLKVGEITRSLKTGEVQFDLSVENIVNPTSVSYWKVRAFCDEDMSIRFSASSTDSCGKAVRFNSFANDAFSFWYDNEGNATKKFSVKLKAYDANGKWMHTSSEAFLWK